MLKKRNELNNEGMGLGPSWEWFSYFCLNENSSLVYLKGIKKSGIFCVRILGQHVTENPTRQTWTKFKLTSIIFYVMKTLEECSTLDHLPSNDTGFHVSSWWKVKGYRWRGEKHVFCYGFDAQGWTEDPNAWSTSAFKWSFQELNIYGFIFLSWLLFSLKQ